MVANRQFYSRIALLFPDWLIVPKATKGLSRYMDSIVDKTLSLPPTELKKRGEQQVTLMEALAIKKLDRKVRTRGRFYSKTKRMTRLVYQRSTDCSITRWKGKTICCMANIS